MILCASKGTSALPRSAAYMFISPLGVVTSDILMWGDVCECVCPRERERETVGVSADYCKGLIEIKCWCPMRWRNTAVVLLLVSVNKICGLYYSNILLAALERSVEARLRWVFMELDTGSAVTCYTSHWAGTLWIPPLFDLFFFPAFCQLFLSIAHPLTALRN